MNNKITFGIGGIIIGSLLVSFFRSNIMFGYRNTSGGMMGNNQKSGNNQMMGNFDKHFIEQMIPRHEGAVAMAKLALVKSKRTEVKTLATAIIENLNIFFMLLLFSRLVFNWFF